MRNTDIWMDFLIPDEKRYWFINGECEALFYIDKKTNEIFYIADLPGESRLRSYNSGVLHCNELWFMPFNANHILIYNIELNCFRKILVDQSYISRAQFSICIKRGNFAFAIDTYLKHVVLKIDLLREKISEISFANYIKETDCLCRDYVLVEDKLYLADVDNPIILSIDINTGSVEKFFIEESVQGFGTIEKWNEKIILSSGNGLFIWDMDKKKTEKCISFDKVCGVQKKEQDRIVLEKGFSQLSAKYKQPFWKSYLYNGKIWFISAVMNCSLIYDIVQDKIESINLGEEEFFDINIENPLEERVSIIKHLFSLVEKDELLCYLTKSNSIIKINMNNWERGYVEFPISVDKGILYKILKKRKYQVIENKKFGVEEWIKFVKVH